MLEMGLQVIDIFWYIQKFSKMNIFKIRGEKLILKFLGKFLKNLSEHPYAKNYMILSEVFLNPITTL